MAAEPSVLYRPSPWQQRYHDCDYEELLGAGSAGPGKTQCLIFEPINQVLIEHARCMGDPSLAAKPGTKLWDLIEQNPLRWGASVGHALYLRRTSMRLEPIIARTHRLFKQIDPDAEYSVQKMTWHFKSGYRYQFGHCVNRDDWEQYLGVELSIAIFDELIEFEEEQYEVIKGRVRTTDPVLSQFLKTRAMSNPVMRRSRTENYIISNPMWVRDYFVAPAPQGNVPLVRNIKYKGIERTVRRMYMPATIDDNPDKEFVEQYKTTLVAMKPHQRKALLDGDWFSVIGGYYADVWDPSLHVCRPFRIPEDWSQFRMMDWGFKHEGCVLWGALDGDGNLYIHREYDFAGKEAAVVAREIREIEKDMGLWASGKSRITGPADTQLWEERGDLGVSKAMEMAKVGVRWAQANKRSRARNGMRVYERLRATGSAEETGGLIIFETCNKLIRTLPAVQTDPNDDSGETPAKSNDDDAVDCLGYGVEWIQSRQHPPMAPPDGGKHGEWADDEEPDEEPDLGRDGYGG